MRVGVVLLVPQPAATEIDGLRRACGDAMLGLVPAHITLVPPVNVRAEEVQTAVDVVTAAASVVRPLELTVGPAATFFPVTSVLYLAVGGDTQAVVQLHKAVLAGPLARPEEWPYVPHVTLATDQTPERLSAGVSALSDFRVPVTVGAIHVLRQEDDHAWRPLADAPLRAPAVVGRGGLPVELSVSEQLGPEAVTFLSNATGLSPIGRPFAVTARREGKICGVATGWSTEREAVLDQLVVGADVQGQGVGSHLLAAVEAWAVQQGVGRAVVAAPEGAASGFFRSKGWRPDRRPGGAVVRLVRDLGPG